MDAPNVSTLLGSQKASLAIHPRSARVNEQLRPSDRHAVEILPSPYSSRADFPETASRACARSTEGERE